MQKKRQYQKALTVGIASLLLLSLSSCGAASSVPEVSPLPENYESVEGQQVKMTAGDVEVIITLNDSRAAADFVRMLPLELTLIERNEFAKGMTLPRKLDTHEATTREYEIGDFGYWSAGTVRLELMAETAPEASPSVIPGDETNPPLA